MSINKLKSILIIIVFSILINCSYLSFLQKESITYKFPPTENVEILLSKPSKPYITITTIESRGDLRSSLEDLFDNIKEKGKELGADAVIPTKKPNKDNKSSSDFDVFIVRHQNIAGVKVPILMGYAIKYKSSIQELRESGDNFEIDDRPFALGLQSNLVPIIFKGFHTTFWAGKNDFRIRLLYFKHNTPDFFLNYEYQNGKVNSAYGLHVDYFFTKRFNGFFITTGLNLLNGSLAHKLETEIGTYKFGMYALGLGYCKDVYKTFYISTMLAGNFIIFGDLNVKVGTRTVSYYRAIPDISLEFGWRY